MRKFIALLLIISPLLGASIFESKLERAFNALAEYNYFEAKHLFTKSMKKHGCGASFGLSQIFLNDKNPFHNLDSARVYALKSQDLWSETDLKEKEKLDLLGIGNNQIIHQTDTVALRAFYSFEEQNTLDGYEYFLDKYDWSNYIDKTVKHRDKLAFEIAFDNNTSKGYQSFIQAYPDAIQVGQAKTLYDQTIFEESTSVKSIQEYDQFLLENPNSPYRKQAEDQIFILATSSGELIDYLLFIRKFPKNRHIPEAWREVYKARTELLTTENLMEFRLDFPMYPKIDLVKIEISRIQERLFPAREFNLWGFVNQNGEWVINPEFEYCEPFSEGMAIYEEADSYGYVDLHGNKAIKAIYPEAFNFKNGIAVVNNGKFYGAINRFGEEKIPFEFDDIGEFVDGLAYAQKDDKYGFINQKGDVIIPFVYEQAFSLNNDRALVKQNGKYGIIDKANTVIQPFNFDWIEPNNSDEILKVKIGDNYGVLNQNGDTLLHIKYDKIGDIENDPILVVYNNKVGYYLQSGDWLIAPKYETNPFVLDWGEFDSGLARIIINEKMGVIDTVDNRIVPAIFESMGMYEEPLYPIKKNGFWGYADSDVKLMIKYKYQVAMPFVDSLAIVKLNDKWGMINLENEVVLPFEFNRIKRLDNEYILENDSAVGLLDIKGDTILPIIFSEINTSTDDYFIVNYKGKLAYFDFKARIFFWREEGFDFLVNFEK